MLISVQQSSFYGYTSMLPPRYTQAVMTGESKHVMVLLVASSSALIIYSYSAINFVPGAVYVKSVGPYPQNFVPKQFVEI